jgi:polyisoprenoid-binding protein YceI
MKKAILVIALAIVAGASFGQKKSTTSAVITFDATTPSDKLPKAENKTAIAALDTRKGTVAFEAIIKNFSFENPMMQEHFNSDKWLNSETFTTAKFKGNITNLSEISFSKDGAYTANVEGDLTIHGVTQKVNTTVAIVVAGASIKTSSSFSIKLEDYKIDVGNAGGKVAKAPKIDVAANF